MVTKYAPLLLGFLLWLSNLASAEPSNILPKPGNAKRQTPSVVTNIFYLGDSYLDDGNYKAITGYPMEYFSNGPPWGTDVNLALGFTAVGRWTAAGSPPNSLGNNYAVAGAGISGSVTPVDSSFRGQVNLMVSDYPKGLPADTLVVVAIGTNDVLGALYLGGLWSLNLSGWRLSDSTSDSTFTVPAVGSTVTVQVADTTGLVAGPNNLVVFPRGPNLPVFSVTAVDLQTSSVTLTNVTGTPGTKVSREAGFEMAGLFFLALELPIFTQSINALLADGASLVLTLPWRTDLLPRFYQGVDQGLAYTTWLYFYGKMAKAISKKRYGGLYFDVSDFFETVFSNFTEYGFLYNYPGWDNNPNVSANEFVFWDDAHPSGEMHQLIASDFIQFLVQAGLPSKQ
jgi:lysophospholipase L1-like esterase